MSLFLTHYCSTRPKTIIFLNRNQQFDFSVAGTQRKSNWTLYLKNQFDRNFQTKGKKNLWTNTQVVEEWEELTGGDWTPYVLRMAIASRLEPRAEKGLQPYPRALRWPNKHFWLADYPGDEIVDFCWLPRGRKTRFWLAGWRKTRIWLADESKIRVYSTQCIKIGYTSAHFVKIGYSSAQCIKIGYGNFN